MSLSIEQVEHIGKLARLEFTPEEKSMFQDQLSSILEYVDKLNEVDTEGVEPVTGGTELTSVMRSDKVELTSEELRENILSQAPMREGEYVKTKGVFE